MGEDVRQGEQQDAAHEGGAREEANTSNVALAKTVTSGSQPGDRSDRADSDPPASSSEEPQRNFTAGELLAGRYEIVRFIAQGGMGEVYEAIDHELRTRVALKTVRANRVGRNAVDRLKREIHLARQVRHVNVCHLFEVGFHTPAGDGRRTVFLTMELLQGETLAERLRRVGTLSTSEALPLLRQMAAGIDAAHAQGIIHRDFKPDNVFLVPAPRSESDIRVVITDFGVARGADQQVDAFSFETGEGAVIGTPLYMAPEQRVGAEVSPATDLYSFGLVLREMVTGEVPGGRRRPPHGSGAASIAAPITLDGEPALEPGWVAVIARLLSISPEKRPGSAGEAVTALEPAAPASAVLPSLAGTDPAVRAQSAQTRRVARRSRATAAALGAVLLVALLVTLGLVLPAKRRTELPPPVAPSTATPTVPAPAAGPPTAPAAAPPAATAPSVATLPANEMPAPSTRHDVPPVPPRRAGTLGAASSPTGATAGARRAGQSSGKRKGLPTPPRTPNHDVSEKIRPPLFE